MATPQSDQAHSTTAIVLTESPGLVGSFQRSLYGEEDETCIEYFYEANGNPLSLDDDLPWHARWRLWLLQQTGKARTRHLPIHGTTGTLQLILGDMQADLVFVQDDVPSSATLAVATQETDEDDLLNFPTANVSHDWQKDCLITAWTRHQRFFVLADLQEIWESLSVADQGLVRAVVSGIDRLTASHAATPAWMEAGGGLRKIATTPITPGLVCQSYFQEQQHRPAIRTIASFTSSIDTANYDQFLTWIQAQHPDDSTLDNLTERLGREGCRGDLALRIYASQAEKELLPRTSALKRLLGRQDDGTRQNIDARRGRALLQALDTSRSPGTRASIGLFSWGEYSGDPSLTDVIKQYLLDRPGIPNVNALAQWLWHGAEVISKRKKHDWLWSDILCAVKHFADWIPVAPLLLGYRSFLRRVVSMDDAECPAPGATVSQTQALTELLATWIDGRSDWIPFLLQEVFGETSEMVPTLLGLYISVECLGSDFALVHTSLDVSRTLTACTALLTVLKSLVGDANRQIQVAEAVPHLAGIIALFSRVQLPLSQTSPGAVQDAIKGIQQGFRSLAESFAVSVLPLKDYLQSLLRFTVESSFAVSPKWCLQVALTCRSCWPNDNLCESWIRLLLTQLASQSNANPMLLQFLHESMVRQCCSENANVPSKSVVEILLESAQSQSHTAAERILSMTPPTHVFVGSSSSEPLATTLMNALEAFNGPLVACLLLGIALRLDSLSPLNSRDATYHHAQRKDCLQLCRIYLLDKVRCGSPLESWLVSLQSQIHEELRSRQATVGAEWWKEACLDILDDSVSMQQRQEPLVASIVSSIERLPASEATQAPPSRKRAAVTLEPSSTVAQFSETKVAVTGSTIQRSEVATGKLQQVLLRGADAATNTATTATIATTVTTMIGERSSVPMGMPIPTTRQEPEQSVVGDWDVAPAPDDNESDPGGIPESSPDEDDYDEDDDRILLLDL